MVLEIKRLLYEQRFTIEGARKHLETRAKTEAPAAKPSKRRSAKTGAAGLAPAAAAPKGQVDLFGDGNSAGTLELVGKLELMRKELREILTLLQ